MRGAGAYTYAPGRPLPRPAMPKARRKAVTGYNRLESAVGKQALSAAPNNPSHLSTGIVLSGGGARGAYEAGVVHGLMEVLRPTAPPFDVLTGTSVGALNATYLAAHSHLSDMGAHALCERGARSTSRRTCASTCAACSAGGAIGRPITTRTIGCRAAPGARCSTRVRSRRSCAAACRGIGCTPTSAKAGSAR